MAVQPGEGGRSSMNLWTASFFIFTLKAPKMIRLVLGKEFGSTETHTCTTAETRGHSHHSSQFRTPPGGAQEVSDQREIWTL